MGDTQKNIVAAMISEALAGNVKAFESIRDTIGENPTSKVLQQSQITKAVVVFDTQKADKSPAECEDIKKDIITPIDAVTPLEIEKKGQNSEESNTPTRLAYPMGGGLYTHLSSKDSQNLDTITIDNHSDEDSIVSKDVSVSGLEGSTGVDLFREHRDSEDVIKLEKTAKNLEEEEVVAD